MFQKNILTDILINFIEFKMIIITNRQSVLTTSEMFILLFLISIILTAAFAGINYFDKGNK